MKRKMVCMLNLSEQAVKQIQTMAPDWEIIYGRDSEVWKSHLLDAEILMNWNEYADEVCFREEAKLRWVHTWAAGVDDLPFEKFKKRNIVLTNSSGVHAYPVSETVFAMILALTRNLHTYIRSQIKHEWNRGRNPLEAHGKTMGIVGVGAIGAEIARLAKAFGMKVLGVSRTGKPVPEVDEMYDFNGIHTVLSQSDYIVLALPLTKDTYHLIDKEEFQIMKPTAFFVNISRGETTNTEALIHALKNEWIAGAGLDVFEQEPLPVDHPLWDFHNVIITPHTSGFTQHYTERVMNIFLSNFRKYLNGETPDINVVDLDRQY